MERSITFNELALVLLLVRRAVCCAVLPTVVKLRTLGGQNDRNGERDREERHQSYFTLQTQVKDENPELSVFRQRLSQELDGILKDLLCTEYVVILSQ